MKNFISLISLVVSIPTLAQQVDFNKDLFKDRKEEYKKALMDYQQGDYAFAQKKYEEALNFYLKANSFNPSNAELNLKIGKCYLYLGPKTKSIKYFEKAFECMKTVDAEIHFYLGQAYQYNLDWDKAIIEYQKHIEIFSGNTEQMSKAWKKIKECELGKELSQRPVKVKIENFGKTINSAFSDYGAVISADESVIMFISRREGTTGGYYDINLNEYNEDIYISHNIKGDWTKPSNLGPPVNTNAHDAICALSPDGQKMLIYRDDDGDGNIYESDLKGKTWSAPKKLENINTPFHESSASFSYDGKTLYFVSNKRENNFGGRDIFYSKWDEKTKKWGEPINLSQVINTEYDEETVFAHPDGKTIYFSSNGHNTIGGYDVFKSVYTDGKWSEPENLGFPINTSDDDLFFVISASGKHAYYTSIKEEGFGRRDLYKITFLEEGIAPPQLTLLKGTVMDAVTKEPLGAKIEIIDNEKNESITEIESNSATGRYLVSLPSGKNYGISATAQGYLFHSENVNIPPSMGYQEIEKDILLNKLVAGSTIILNNIFFDFDKATLRPESEAELERLVKLMNENPALKVELSGHTDNKGSAEYNQKLSENRAKAVVDYLIERGIGKDRLKYVGYGMMKPIAPNTNPDGSDNPDGRQLNRRTEFKILE